MSVTLTAEQEREIAERIASGRYPSAERVIGAALAALRQVEELEATRAALVADIDQGIASLDAGLGVPLTRDTIEAIKTEGRKRLTERNGSNHG